MHLPAEATRLLSREHLASIEAWWAGLYGRGGVRSTLAIR